MNKYLLFFIFFLFFSNSSFSEVKLTKLLDQGLDRGPVGWHVREARTIESEREADTRRDGMSEPQPPAPTQQSLTPVTTVMNQAALVRCMDPVRSGVASRIGHSVADTAT